MTRKGQKAKRHHSTPPTAKPSFPFDELPPEIRNIIYQLSIPAGQFFNLQGVNIPGICQMTATTHEEALPLFITSNTWIWNCYSRDAYPLLRDKARPILPSLLAAHCGLHSPWLPHADSRVYLKIPQHVTTRLTRLVATGATDAMGRLFAVSAHINSDSDLRKSAATENAVLVSADPEADVPGLSNAIEADLDKALEEMLELPVFRRDAPVLTVRQRLQTEMSKARQARSNKGKARLGGFDNMDLYLIWREIYIATGALYYGPHAKGDPAEMSGLWDDVFTE